MRTQHRQLMTRRNGVMNRSETRLYNLELKVLASKKWARMMATVDIGVPNPASPKARQVKMNGRLKKCYAYAGQELNFSKDSYQRYSPKRLRESIAHELIHYYLMDNNCPEKRDHGPIFQACCQVMGLDDAWAKEVPHSYQYVCECGWWVKTSKRIKAYRCRGCLKDMVLKVEYEKLRKMAAIGSNTINLNMSRYAVMTEKNIDPRKKHIRRNQVCPSTQVDASTIDVGEMGSTPQVADSIAPSISMRQTER